MNGPTLSDDEADAIIAQLSAPLGQRLTQHIAALITDLDEARRERDAARTDAKAEFSKALQEKAEGWGKAIDAHANDALEARAQAVAATTQADDLRARVEAAVATWPPGPRKGDVLRALEER